MTKLSHKKDRNKQVEKARLDDFETFETFLDGTTTVGRRRYERTTTVAASAKDLFVDKRRVKWENVLSMTLLPSSSFSTKNESKDRYGDGDDDLDVDDVVEYSLEITCREQKQDKDHHQYVASEDYFGPVRTFRVTKVVYHDDDAYDNHNNNERSSSSWKSQWHKFQRVLNEFYEKELKKRERRKERLQEEKRSHSKNAKANNTTTGGGRRSRSTFSKREAFLINNRKNIESNRTLPDTYDDTVNLDEEDDDFFETYGKENETPQETMRRLQGLETVFGSNSGAAGADKQEQDDENDDDNDGDEAEWNGVADAKNGDPEDAPGLSGDGDDHLLNDDDSAPLDHFRKEDEVEKGAKEKDKAESNSKGGSSKTLRFPSLRMKDARKAPVLDDDTDDEDDLFGTDSQKQTTPSIFTQRLVSPSTIKARKRKHVLNDDSDDEDSNRVTPASPVAKELEEEDETKEDEEDPSKGIPKITSFFSSSTAPSTKSTIGTKPSTLRSDKKKEPKANNDVDSLLGDTDDDSAKPQLSTKYSVAAMNFFVPRKPKTDLTTKATPKTSRKATGRDPTLSDTLTPSSRRHATDIESDHESDSEPVEKLTPKMSVTPNRRIFSVKRKTVEEEDPIEEVDSSQSQSPAGRHRKRSRLLAKKPHRNASIAFNALDMADQSSSKKLHELVPVVHARPSAYSSTKKDRTKFSPSRMQISPSRRPPPTQLNFDAAVDDQEPPTEQWRGLSNEGNTCYVNSSLQALFSVKSFMKALSPLQEGHPLVQNLVTLWNTLKNKSLLGSASARKVKAEIDKITNQFEGNEQRDAHEFLNEMMDRVHEELKTTNPASSDTEQDTDSDVGREPIDDFFRMDVRVCLKCESCGYSRTKDEVYKNLSLDIYRPEDLSVESGLGKATVATCLSRFFEPELREIKCEKCEEGRFATQQMKILSKPKALLLHLKRFIVQEQPANNENDPNGSAIEFVFRKKKTLVELDNAISLDEFLANDIKTTEEGTVDVDATYSIKAIVNHIGPTIGSGHYTADAVRGEDTWVSFNDGITRETTLDNIVVAKQRSAYMIMYSLD